MHGLQMCKHVPRDGPDITPEISRKEVWPGSRAKNSLGGDYALAHFSFIILLQRTPLMQWRIQRGQGAMAAKLMTVDWAGVLDWTYYSAEANSQMGRRMHQFTHFETQK